MIKYYKHLTKLSRNKANQEIKYKVRKLKF